MEQPTPLALHRRLRATMESAEADPRLGAEIVRARREFFSAEAPATDPLQQAASEARFEEWYLLERESEVLGDIPVASLWAGQLDREQRMLGESLVGVFQVEGVSDTVQLRDLQDDVRHEMATSSMLEVSTDDLVIGRLFADESGCFVPAATVAVQKGADDLAMAFAADIAGLGLGRRLNQLELEHLLFRRFETAGVGEAPDPVEVEAKLRAVLATAGEPDETVAELSRLLAEAPTPGAVIGPMLDQLAFDTDVDLENARRLLLDLWSAHHAGDAPAVDPEAPPQPAETADDDPELSTEDSGLGARMARRIEEGLAANENVEELFESVEAMLGEPADEDDEGELIGSAAGDLEPLIQEFLWEEQCGDGPQATVLAEFLAQQNDLPVPRLDMEAVETGDVERFLLGAFLRTVPAERATVVTALTETLQQFFAWGVRTQEYDLADVLASLREGFAAEVPRLQRASLELSTTDAPSTAAPPILLRVIRTDSEGVEVVPGESEDPTWLNGVKRWDDLREGDLILAVASGDPAAGLTLQGVVVVIPAGSEALLG